MQMLEMTKKGAHKNMWISSLLLPVTFVVDLFFVCSLLTFFCYYSPITADLVISYYLVFVYRFSGLYQVHFSQLSKLQSLFLILLRLFIWYYSAVWAFANYQALNNSTTILKASEQGQLSITYQQNPDLLAVQQQLEFYCLGKGVTLRKPPGHARTTTCATPLYMRAQLIDSQKQERIPMLKCSTLR
jgi:hypothetical protein